MWPIKLVIISTQFCLPIAGLDWMDQTMAMKITPANFAKLVSVLNWSTGNWYNFCNTFDSQKASYCNTNQLHRGKYKKRIKSNVVLGLVKPHLLATSVWVLTKVICMFGGKRNGVVSKRQSVCDIGYLLAYGQSIEAVIACMVATVTVPDTVTEILWPCKENTWSVCMLQFAHKVQVHLPTKKAICTFPR